MCIRDSYQTHRGIEVGHVFFLGTKYSEAMRATFLDAQGQETPLVMGCYGIGVTRTVAAVIEQNYDADGIVWPWPVAPYQVHLLDLDPGNPEVRAVADEAERALEAEGFEVLHDEREGLSPGAKFKDADLLGFPLRLMVGSRGLKEGVVELRDRRSREVLKLPPGEVVAQVRAARARILGELEAAGGR